MYLSISKFAGLYTNIDARSIRPNKDTKGVADAVEMTNMDLLGDGGMVTSKGFSEVSHIAGTGGVLNLLNYEKDEDNRWLLITHGDDHYSITPSTTAWSSTNLGDYGDIANYVAGTVYASAAGTRKAILGNDVSGNSTQKADLSGAMAAAGAGAPDGYVMAVFMGRLFTATGITLSYSGADDETSLGGSIKFNDIITGLRVEGKRMIVFTRSYHQGIFFEYSDAFNLSTPLKEPYERPFGCLAHKTIQATGSDVYYWSDRGVLKLGAEINYNDGEPRPQSLSERIESSLQNANWGYRLKATSAYWDDKRQYWLATPFGTETINSICWVYWDDYRAWTTRSGFYPADLETFRNTDYKHDLYFGDANNPYLYKFNDAYSYDGIGYTRRWKSKIFTMGTNIYFKQFRGIEITGSMDAATKFYVTLDVDGTKKKYEIDNTFLLRTSFGDYIGDTILGDEWQGGDAPSESRFKRFYAPLDFDKAIREGIEIQITIENDAAEQPFKIDFIGIEYEILARKQRPRREYVNTQVST